MAQRTAIGSGPTITPRPGFGTVFWTVGAQSTARAVFHNADFLPFRTRRILNIIIELPFQLRGLDAPPAELSPSAKLPSAGKTWLY
ncbi:MAG TPA: hypothetical protein PLZ55_11605 [bacterium]|nr:hypothetical protein [bacterium]HPO09305.1 hypothetical protein [bacterium]HQO33152.1 hypothetical protein [bacterium]HQP98494.1 hypothetical protein [bacterium]